MRALGRLWVLGLLALPALAFSACGRGAATAGTTATGPDGGVLAEGAPVSAAASTAPDPMVEDLWARAEEGEVADLARLYDREGETGLIERAAIPAYRQTALAALSCGQDFSSLPFLAAIGLTGTEDEARVALESAEALASVPRRARDPEDALELRQGCDALNTLARTPALSPARRSRAISALRMLVGTGCIKAESIPKDLDPK